MPPVALRPRSTTEIIDAAAQLFRQHYKELVTVTALFMIPVIIARATFMPQALSPAQLLPMSGVLGSMLWGILYFVLGTMSTAAVVVIVSDSYLGREVTISGAIKRMVGRLGTVVGAVLMQGILSALGIFFFFIGAVVVACWLFATTNVVMVEGTGITDALARSRKLARGSVGRIFRTVALAAVMVWLLEALVSTALLLVFSPFRSESAVVTFALQLTPNVVAIFIVPFITVVITLLYYDLRIRKEGFDLELMARELGFVTPLLAGA